MGSVQAHESLNRTIFAMLGWHSTTGADNVNSVLTEADIVHAGKCIAQAASSPATVILFGSWARGENRPDSDLDFLVVEDFFDTKIAEMGRLREAVPKLGVPVDVVVATRDEAERKRHAVGSLIRFALREGRVVHESE